MTLTGVINTLMWNSQVGAPAVTRERNRGVPDTHPALMILKTRAENGVSPAGIRRNFFRYCPQFASLLSQERFLYKLPRHGANCKRGKAAQLHRDHVSSLARLID